MLYMLIKHFSAKKCKHFRRFTFKKINRNFFVKLMKITP